MGFVSLKFYQFRNIVDSSISLQGSTIFLVGKNGQGKSNFLEAVYLLSYGSSFRVSKDRLLVKRDSGEKSYSLKGEYRTRCEKGGDRNPGFSGSVLLSYQSSSGGQKRIEVNGERVQSRRELVNLIPSVVFCHGDNRFVTGSPEQQRWFFNHLISQVDPEYLKNLLEYRKILKQRNFLLKQGSSDQLLGVYDNHLACKGLLLRDSRAYLMDGFNQVFTEIYRQITGEKKAVSLQYRPSWEASDPKGIEGRLYENREKDFHLSTTTTGPHRDRYRFDFEGKDYSEIASTGQIRLLSLILRITQAVHFAQRTGRKPVLLLDDVMLELDGETRKQFMASLPAYEQAFFTFLPEEPFEQYLQRDRQVIYVDQGKLTTAKGRGE